MSLHIFAVYHAAPITSINNRITLKDEEIFHRIRRVLHLENNDTVIIFDTTHTYTCHITALHEKTSVLELLIQNQSAIKENKPALHLYCGITKREAFEALVYAAGQLGVATVHPVISDKIHRNWIGQKDLARLEKIAIAGCEQAKQFCKPIITQPQSFKTLMSVKNLFVAEAGLPPLQAILTREKPPTEMSILIGPEGGLTDKEISELKKAQAQLFSLTPSILRSQDAAFLSIGIIRTFFGA